MHIKFLAHGTGDPARAAAYVMDSKDHQNIDRAGVEVLRGDPQTFAAIAGSLTSVHRYTSGVIAWAGDDAPTDEEISAVLDDFERVAFAGLEPDEYHFCAVQHVEPDGSKHVHILVPRVNLKTGQALNIAPPNWEYTYDPLRDSWNWEKGWARPDDPNRAKLVQRGHVEYQDAAAARAGLEVEPDAKQLLSDYIAQRVEAGAITNRGEVVAALAELGEVTRQGKDYISVKPEGHDKAIRLKGGLFDERFDPKTWLDAATENRRGQNTDRAGREPVTAEHRANAEAARARLADAIERREKYNRGRYHRAANRAKQATAEAGNEHQPDHGEGSRSDQNADRAGHKAPDMDDAATVLALAGRFVRAGSGALDSHTTRPMAGDNHHGNDEQQQGLHGNHVAGLDSMHHRPEQIPLQAGEIKNDPAREIVNSAIERISRAIQSAVDKIESAIRGFSNEITRNESATRRYDHELSELAQRFSDTATERVARDETIAKQHRGINEGIKIVRQNNEDEIRRFKSEINLAEFLQNRGYEYDKKESSKNSAIMRRGSDKLIVATDQDGHGVYFNVKDEQDSGTIIDFIQQREGLNLGQVRKMLRPWIGESSSPIPSPLSPIPKPAKGAANLVMAQNRYLSMPEYTGNYLQSRGLSNATIDEFSPKIKQDERGNVCFRHWHPDGISGYEIKNAGFTGFASGGEKSIFTHITGDKISRIVVTESAIDCMSYHQLKGQPDTLYLSIAGQMSDKQRETIKKVLGDQKQAEVISAFDADEQGNKFAAFISTIRPDSKRELPEVGKDWNDQLKSTINKRSEMALQKLKHANEDRGYDYPSP